MANDTTLKSVFDHAKQGQLSSGEFPKFAAVRATFVEHFPNSHPPQATETADLVTYANGLLTLSANKKKLSGELKLWRNRFVAGMPQFFDAPATDDDAFADEDGPLTVVISVTDAGAATHQRRLNGNPIGGLPPAKIDATFQNAMFVETGPASVRSLSFTLGSTQ